MSAPQPLFLAGKPHPGASSFAVSEKFSGEGIAEVASADAKLLLEAIACAERARPAMAQLPPYRRREVLLSVSAGIAERAAEFAELICRESGKPIRDARTEVERAIDTFRIAAEEAMRRDGQIPEVVTSPRGEGFRCLVKPVPVGVCALITPFNFPLNLVAHKVAPAIAAGCPFLLKPASATPLSALALGRLLADAGLPEGAFSILPMPASEAGALIEDERIALLSFTGSAKVGWALKSRAGRKRVLLELGGNAACIVDGDQEHRLPWIAERLLFGAFYQAGQSCISVQRILIHERLYEALREQLREGAARLPVGDPRREETVIGPMIEENEARRVEAWIERALARGARPIIGGARQGALMPPHLLEGVPEDEPLSCEEVFGPVAILAPFSDFEQALRAVNRSAYGLQAGVFTGSLEHALAAWERLEVGAVVVGDIPSVRLDAMPYGGVKGSGIGREGLRYAIAEMSEPRTFLIRG